MAESQRRKSVQKAESLLFFGDANVLIYPLNDVEFEVNNMSINQILNKNVIHLEALRNYKKKKKILEALTW